MKSICNFFSLFTILVVANICNSKHESIKSNKKVLSKTLPRKLSMVQKRNLLVTKARLAKLSAEDQRKLYSILEGTTSDNPKIRELALIELKKNRNLISSDTGLSIGLGLVGTASALYLMGFLRQFLELREFKGKYEVIQRKLLYSNISKKNAMEALGNHIASLQSQVGMLTDHMFTKSNELSNFVDTHQLY